MRQMYNHVKENCLDIPPEEFNSIDEQMIPFKGQSGMSLDAYNASKPVKRGFKVLSRCGSWTGIIYDFDLCTGNL